MLFYLNKLKVTFYYQNWTILSLLFIIPIGFYSKFYSGLASHWINNSLSGVFYEIFWCILIFLFLKNENPLKIVMFVLFTTCLLEFLQLIDFALLKFIRSYFIGRILIGTTFVWSDFLYYFIGSAIGWLWIMQLKKCQFNS